MIYLLKEITAKDYDMILNDLSCDESKKLTMLRFYNFNDRGMMAIDEVERSYIFCSPPSLGESIRSWFYFFHKNCWYELSVGPMFENLVRFEDAEPDNLEERNEFRENLKHALTTIGRYGSGIKGFLDVIDPRFEG